MEYTVRESMRAKYLSVAIRPDGEVIVTKPLRVSVRALERWINTKRGWIEEMREKFRRHHESTERLYGKAIVLPKLRRGTKVYKETIEKARTIATARVRHFAALGNFTPGSISIRNQKTRWGSCSTRGNLSFNYRLAHLPADVADYLIVHELAHTKHHNHSVRFWEEVGIHIPEYKKLRRELHRYRF